MENCILHKTTRMMLKIKTIVTIRLIQSILKLSVVSKVLETLLFLALVSWREVSKMTISSIWLELKALFCFYSKNSEYCRKFLTLLFPYAKILNKTLNKGESQTWKQLSLFNLLCCWGIRASAEALVLFGLPSGQKHLAWLTEWDVFLYIHYIEMRRPYA